MTVVYVVVVTYNPMKWIDRCLESLKKSSIMLEVVVVDNNSQDNSPAYIEQHYAEVNLIRNKENLGFGSANNIGIKKAYEAGADYIFLLNQDAWIEPDTIEKLISAQQQEPQYGVISPIHLNGKGDALDYNFSQYIIPSRCKNLYSDIFLQNIKNSIYEVEFVNAAAWLISRDCIENVGGFNPSFFHYGEDDNYIQRARFHSFKIGVLPTCVIFHDREMRIDTPFQNDLSLFKRIVILKVSNPFSDYNFNNEYKKLIKNLITSIIYLRFEMIKRTFSKIFILNKIDKKFIISNKKISKTDKLVFLN